MSKKHKNVSTILNYSEQFLILVSGIKGCVSVSAFVSLLGVLIVITSSAIKLKICAIITGIKKFESIIKKQKKKTR